MKKATSKTTAKATRARKINPEDLTVDDLHQIANRLGFRMKMTMPATANFEAFWMVHVEGKPGPTKRHTSAIEARAEANRLALKEQATAYVLVSLASVRPEPQEVTMGFPFFVSREGAKDAKA